MYVWLYPLPLPLHLHHWTLPYPSLILLKRHQTIVCNICLLQWYHPSLILFKPKVKYMLSMMSQDMISIFVCFLGFKEYMMIKYSFVWFFVWCILYPLCKNRFWLSMHILLLIKKLTRYLFYVFHYLCEVVMFICVSVYFL